MRSTWGILPALVCALAAAVVPCAGAAETRRPPVTWLKGEGNYTKAHRPPRAIRQVVVHVTEGAFWGSVTWLRNNRSHASAHYVVSRRGEIIQLVHQSDVAWHAGNRRVNEHSVGIEHEGFTDDPAGFTAAQYRASARLTAYIARRSLLPLDRRHLIGHDEVPDPNDPARAGGSSHHTDPGRYWSWRRYLRLVRRYARPPVRRAKPKPPPLRVESTTVYRGQTVRGTVPWRARTTGPAAARVDFVVDGRVLWRDHRRPFAFARATGWNTATVANGRHALELRAYGVRGEVARVRIPIRVRNAPLVLRAVGVRHRGYVAGVVRVTASLRGSSPRAAELFVGGRRVGVDRRRPFRLSWDSRRARNGVHRLELRVRARDGRRARRRVEVIVANPVARPPVGIVRQSLADGQLVSGAVPWTVEVVGVVARVEFLVDGTLRWTAPAPPYAFGEGGVWETAVESPGPHVLTARATAVDGRVVEASVTVVVAPG